MYVFLYLSLFCVSTSNMTTSPHPAGGLALVGSAPTCSPSSYAPLLLPSHSPHIQQLEGSSTLNLSFSCSKPFVAPWCDEQNSQTPQLRIQDPSGPGLCCPAFQVHELRRAPRKPSGKAEDHDVDLSSLSALPHSPRYASVTQALPSGLHQRQGLLLGILLPLP